MSAVLQLGKRQIAVEEVISLLEKSQLLPQLQRELIVEQAIAPYECTPEEVTRLCEQLEPERQRQGISPEQLRAIATRKLRLEKFKQANWEHKLGGYFLSRKAQLDKVIYLLLRTTEAEVAQEIYFRIQEDEQSFSDLAKQFSQGPEAKNGGKIGPIPMSSLHPRLAQILRSVEPGKLAPLFRLENYFVIVRLEKMLPAQLDDKMRQQLLNELFESWLKENLDKEENELPETPQETDAVELVSATTQAPPQPQPEAVPAAELELPPELEAEEIPEIPHLESEVAPPDSATTAKTEESDETSQTAVGFEDTPEVVELVDETPKTPRTPSNWQKFWNNKVAVRLAACAVPLLLGGFSLYYLASPGGQETTVSAEANVPDTEAFRVAVNHAMTAANLTQAAKTTEEWDRVTSEWQQAIALLQIVPKNEANYAVAQEKIGEYKQYLAYAQGNATQAVDAFRVAVNNAMEAANLTQTAQNSSEWEKVANYWQEAIALMKAVEKNDPNYAVAQQKIAEYQNYLNYAQNNASGA
ncbi:MAG: peptidylprolyl isomerase [Oscillatoria sp. PMC 1068.18]|nr:peptidylprolyl isomerase [Oscillatoria sp. PMC 1076.18]MEC4990399.1 peptidylprolyl isomerase [Oscillatoria sp. PMC 1068.18]